MICPESWQVYLFLIKMDAIIVEVTDDRIMVLGKEGRSMRQPSDEETLMKRVTASADRICSVSCCAISDDVIERIRMWENVKNSQISSFWRIVSQILRIVARFVFDMAMPHFTGFEVTGGWVRKAFPFTSMFCKAEKAVSSKKMLPNVENSHIPKYRGPLLKNDKWQNCKFKQFYWLKYAPSTFVKIYGILRVVSLSRPR